MRTSIYRVTGIALSLTVVALGIAASILLYYAGQDSFDAIYRLNTYVDENNQLHRRIPPKDWISGLMMKGWAFGFVFMVPGLTGSISSFFFKKLLIKMHVVLGAVLLTAGTLLHAGGGMAMIVFRILTFNGVINFDRWPSDCVYVKHDDDDRLYESDGKCEQGRKALHNAIAATIVCFVAWVFLLCQLLFVAFTFHNIGETHTKVDIETDNPHIEETKLLKPPGQITSHDNFDSQDPPPAQTSSTVSTLQKREVKDLAGEPDENISDKPVSVEMVDMDEGEMVDMDEGEKTAL